MGRPIKTDNGVNLVVWQDGSMTGDTWTFNVGDWWSNVESGFWPADQFNDQFVTKASLATPPDGVGTMDGVSVAVPILLLNASVDRVVTWNRPFADTSYKTSFLFGAGTLGRITCAVKAGTKTASGLTVTITAGLLAVTVADVVHVLGTT